MKQYMKSRAAEYIAFVCLVSGIGFAICAGFLLTGPFQDFPPLTLLTAAVFSGLFYALAFNRTTAVFGTVAAAAAAGVLILVIQMTDPFGDEEENSAFLFFLILFLVTAVAFLLTRTRAGCAVSLLLGNLIFAGSYFLDFPVRIWELFLLVAGG